MRRVADWERSMGRILLPVGIISVIVAVSCRLALPGGFGDGRQSGTDQRYPGISAASLGPHRSQFRLDFEDGDPWSYRLETARAGTQIGHLLDLEGVPLSVSPGDVRLIIEAGQVRMSGEATQGACWLFPEKSELQRSFLTPDSLFEPQELELELEDDDDQVAGRRAARYAIREGFSERWQDIEGTVWLDGSTGAILRFDFSVRGQDPFFASGSGRIEGQYRVLEFGTPELEPIEGCELPYPVPEDASELVLLEDYMAFETGSSRPEMIQFYARWLEEEGWELSSGPQEGQFGTTMAFRQGDRLKEVSAREVEGGTKVEIFSEAAD